MFGMIFESALTVTVQSKMRHKHIGALGIQKMQRNGHVSRWCSAKTEIVAGGGRGRDAERERERGGVKEGN